MKNNSKMQNSCQKLEQTCTKQADENLNCINSSRKGLKTNLLKAQQIYTKISTTQTIKSIRILTQPRMIEPKFVESAINLNCIQHSRRKSTSDNIYKRLCEKRISTNLLKVLQTVKSQTEINPFPIR